MLESEQYELSMLTERLDKAADAAKRLRVELTRLDMVMPDLRVGGGGGRVAPPEQAKATAEAGHGGRR